MSARRRETPHRSILRSRVGGRLLALILGCVLVPLAILAAVSLSLVSSHLGDGVERLLRDRTRAAATRLAARLEQLEDDLDLVAVELRGRAEGLAGTPGPILDRLQTQFRGIGVVTPAGLRVVLGTTASSLGPLGPLEQVHLAAGATLVRAKPTQRGPASVALVRRLAPNDPASPLLIGDVEASALWGGDGLAGAGADVIVLDDDSRVLFSTVLDGADLRPLEDALARRPRAGTVSWDPLGEPHVAYCWRPFLRPRFGVDWVVALSMPRSRTDSLLAGFYRWFVLIAAFSVVAVSMASVAQVRRTVGPLAELQRATQRVAAGDFSVRVELDREDEFGDLAIAFNRMTEQLVENVRCREQTEKDLVLARDAALTAARTQAEFVTNVSHELRTPMTSILSYAEILRCFETADEGQQREFAEVISDQALRLNDLIGDVLQLGHHRSWDLEAVDVASTLRAAASDLAPAQRARVELAVARSLPAVAGLRDRLEQLWGHLLDNALKFSPPNSPVAVSAMAADAGCVVEIADRGIGIAPHDLERVFEPFCQVGRDIMTEKADGTGLGLSLARNIVARFGGVITARSTVGSGTVMRVVLRAATEPGPPAGSAPGAPQ